MLEREAPVFFDGYAADFAAIYGNDNGWINRTINRLFRRSMRLRYERTLAGCAPIRDCDVLDIGCGPGHYAVALAQKGAKAVLGIDFAEGMLALARARAVSAGVGHVCRFEAMDFLSLPLEPMFDYVIVMGVMDYVAEPTAFVRKATALARRKAFFSFPLAGGFLAWQRQLRYRNRCALYLYEQDQVEHLFAGLPQISIATEKIARDLLVTASRRN